MDQKGTLLLDKRLWTLRAAWTSADSVRVYGQSGPLTSTLSSSLSSFDLGISILDCVWYEGKLVGRRQGGEHSPGIWGKSMAFDSS